MRDIADALGKSVGNITYHYKKKADLIQAIVERQYGELEELELSDKTDLNGLDKQLVSMLDIQGRFRFYFIAILDLRNEFPMIAEFQAKVRQRLIKHFDLLFGHFVEVGIFRPFRDRTQRKSIAGAVVYLMMSWIQQNGNSENGDEREQIDIVWALVYSNLTEKGIAQYRKQIAK